MDYTVHLYKGVIQFFLENNIDLTVIKEQLNSVVLFPRSKPMYRDEDVVRILEIKKYSLTLLYIIDDDAHALYFTDIRFSKSKVKLKIK